MDESRLHFNEDVAWEVECVGGVAGDMLLGAFLDAGADPTLIRGAFRTLGIDALALRSDRVYLAGESALHVCSAPRGKIPGGAHGVHMKDVFRILGMMGLEPAVESLARKVFSILGEAESVAHGVPFDEVHLHEVGEVDSILDVVGVVLAYHNLGCPRLVASSLPSGRGYVDTSHGRLSCPVPAVCEIARRFEVPLDSVEVSGETVTPTGIALLVGLGCEFGEGIFQRYKMLGAGAGSKRFEGRANVVRIWELAA